MIASLHSGRVASWAKATGDAARQKRQVKAWLKKAVDDGSVGGLAEAVAKRLGPIPELPEDGKLQKELEKEYELALYRQKYAEAKWVTTYSTDE